VVDTYVDPGCAATIYANGTFAVTGANGVNSNTITTSASYPLSISMLNTPALTGLLLDITGLANVTVTLSDGSTVSTGVTTYSTPTYVTFISPLQITAASIFFGSSGSLSDLSWGTANIADLPTQPGSGGGSGTSGTPEPATMLLMAGGLLAISRLMKKHSFSF
jgi:hypothetical protein